MRQGMLCLSLAASVMLAALLPASAQSILGKERAAAAELLEQMAGVTQGGLRSGSCLRRTGDEGSEEFAVYLLLPVSRIEGFIVEISGDDGSAGEIVANAGIVSFAANGNTEVRDNLGLEWVAEAYRAAGNFIRSQEMYEDADYAAALARIPTEKCPVPFAMR